MSVRIGISRMTSPQNDDLIEHADSSRLWPPYSMSDRMLQENPLASCP
jgi:hypothetical protein